VTSFDPFSPRPRTACEDCGTPLVFDAAVVPLLRRLSPPESVGYMRFYGDGWSLYGCPRCGLVGAFSPIEPGK